MLTGLRIRVLEGETIDGRREYEFPAAAGDPEKRIVIGRDPAFCHVVFHDDLRLEGLGPEHIALRRSLGHYHLDLNTKHPVLLDGRRTFEEKEITGTHVLRLGNAATIEVTVVDERTPTVGTKPTEQHQEWSLRQRRLLAGLAATVAALAAGGWWYVRTTNQQVAAEAQQVATEARAALAAFADIAPVSDDVIARVQKSVYAIMVRMPDGGEAIVGTGWSARGGKVVTNVHVVDADTNKDLVGLLEKDAEILVRSAVPPHRSHRVIRQTLHPGYRRFTELLAGAVPLRKSLGGFRPVESDSACDVAILDVENADLLAPPLEIAAAEELTNLRAGQPIAMVGYPGEGLMPNDVTRPEPVSQKANIVRMTDFFMNHRDDGHNRLVQHSLPVAGGASGSPIINDDGRVIAVVTAISPVSLDAHDAGGNADAAPAKRRIMNPAAINFGQRADLVGDLLDGREDEATAAYEADWLRSISQLARLSDQVVPMQQQALSQLLGRAVSPRVIREFDGRAASPASDTNLQDMPFEQLDIPRGLITVLVVPEDSVDVDVTLLDGSQPLLATMDREAAYHGEILFPSRFQRQLKLVAWTAPNRNVEPAAYKATVIDWGVDPDDYIRAFAHQQSRAAIRTDAEPGNEQDLEPVRLDATVSIDGQDAAAAELTWTLPMPGVCAVTCRPSQATQLVLMAVGQDGLQPLSPASEAPHAVIPCLTANETNRLVIVAPFTPPGGDSVTVDVHLDTWLPEGER